MRAKFRIAALWNGRSAALRHMRESLARASPDGSLNWLLYAIVAGIAMHHISVVIQELRRSPFGT
jgi:hypothetical protein